MGSPGHLSIRTPRPVISSVVSNYGVSVEACKPGLTPPKLGLHQKSTVFNHEAVKTN